MLLSLKALSQIIWPLTIRPVFTSIFFLQLAPIYIPHSSSSDICSSLSVPCFLFGPLSCSSACLLNFYLFFRSQYRFQGVFFGHPDLHSVPFSCAPIASLAYPSQSISPLLFQYISCIPLEGRRLCIWFCSVLSMMSKKFCIFPPTSLGKQDKLDEYILRIRTFV